MVDVPLDDDVIDDGPAHPVVADTNAAARPRRALNMYTTLGNGLQKLKKRLDGVLSGRFKLLYAKMVGMLEEFRMELEAGGLPDAIRRSLEDFKREMEEGGLPDDIRTEYNRLMRQVRRSASPQVPGATIPAPPDDLGDDGNVYV